MKLKKLFGIGLAIMLAAGAFQAVSATEVTDAEMLQEEISADDAALMATTATSGIFTYEVSGSNATITAIKDNDWPKITIPATLGGKKVVAIADGVGNNRPDMTTLDMASATNLVTIGSNCFSYCPKLSTVNFQTTAKITEIGDNSFYYNPALTTVSGKLTKIEKLGSSVFGLTPYLQAQTDDNVIIGKVLVKYNGTDTDVTVPDNVVYIADAYFGKPIESIDLGDDVEGIGSNAFYGCKELTEIVLPNGCTEIGDMAFSGCTNLKTVTYGDSLTTVGFCAFSNCSSLEGFIYKNAATKTSKVTNIGECAFWNCRKLYDLDTGVIENVNVGSFWNCFGDTPDGTYYYKLPETVKTIAEGGYGNLWFAYVVVPETVQAMASTAFGSSDGATYVVKKDSKAEEFFEDSEYSWINLGDYNADKAINAKDIVSIAGLIADSISDLNYNYGKGVIADADSDETISTKDLYEIMKSIKAEYEAENN